MPMTLVRKLTGVIGELVDVEFDVGALIESMPLEVRDFFAFLLC